MRGNGGGPGGSTPKPQPARSPGSRGEGRPGGRRPGSLSVPGRRRFRALVYSCRDLLCGSSPRAGGGAAGHSTGGTVALLLAAKNPGSVKCMVAVAAPVDRRLQLQYLLQSDAPTSRSWATSSPLWGASWSLRPPPPPRYIGSGMPPVLLHKGPLSPPRPAKAP
jgi:hypothetical protein